MKAETLNERKMRNLAFPVPSQKEAFYLSTRKHSQMQNLQRRADKTNFGVECKMLL